MEEKKTVPEDDVNSLESPDTGPAPSGLGDSTTDAKKEAPKKKKGSFPKRLISHLNIYLLLFILIVIIAVGFTLVSIQKNKKEALPTTIETQTLTQDQLKKLNTGDTSVGDAKQTLTIASNAIFNGKVLIRDSLDIAGGLKIGGPLNLPGLTVSGTTTLDQIQANKLTVSGDANIQGQLTAQKGLTVTGGASFGGAISAPQITVQNFQLSGDLQLNRHIDAGGATPSKTDGGALGSGGTASVSGSDTAGTVTVNTGGGPSAGCFVTVKFSQTFNATPHVVVTPVGSAAGGLNFYVTRTPNDFTLCTTNAAPGGANFSFDYVAID